MWSVLALLVHWAWGRVCGGGRLKRPALLLRSVEQRRSLRPRTAASCAAIADRARPRRLGQVGGLARRGRRGARLGGRAADRILARRPRYRGDPRRELSAPDVPPHRVAAPAPTRPAPSPAPRLPLRSATR